MHSRRGEGPGIGRAPKIEETFPFAFVVRQDLCFREYQEAQRRFRGVEGGASANELVDRTRCVAPNRGEIAEANGGPQV